MLTNQSIVNDQYFSLFHMNIRSTKANLPKTVAFAKCLQVRFSVLGFSETWLNEHEKHLYNIPGYNQIDKRRSTEYYSKGGGVSLFIDERFVFREREDLCMGTDIWTSLFVEIEMNVKILIGIIYRPPDSNLQMFNASLSITLDKIKSEKVNCYLMGDTNIDLFKHVSHKDTQEFLNLMYSNGFVPLINRPTRLSKDGKSATCIDHIFTNNISICHNTQQGILLSDITDHFPIFHLAQLLESGSAQTVDEFIYIRKFTPKNIASFKNDLSTKDWSSVLSNDECLTAFNRFYDEFKKAYNLAFPLIKVKKKYKNQAPWVEDSLRISIIKKNKLYKNSKIHPTVFNKNEYSKYRNRLSKILKSQQKRYYENLIRENQNNLAKTWNIIKTVLNRRNQSQKSSKFTTSSGNITDNNEIARHFNEYFANIGPNLAMDIPLSPVSFHTFLKFSYLNSMYLDCG